MDSKNNGSKKLEAKWIGHAIVLSEGYSGVAKVKVPLGKVDLVSADHLLMFKLTMSLKVTVVIKDLVKCFSH